MWRPVIELGKIYAFVDYWVQASTVVTTYTYNAANRLTKVGGITYTWDNNGNLTSDGGSLYSYDQANRMISTTLSGSTTLFNYNGDGVRLKKVIVGELTQLMSLVI